MAVRAMFHNGLIEEGKKFVEEFPWALAREAAYSEESNVVDAFFLLDNPDYKNLLEEKLPGDSPELIARRVHFSFAHSPWAFNQTEDLTKEIYDWLKNFADPSFPAERSEERIRILTQTLGEAALAAIERGDRTLASLSLSHLARFKADSATRYIYQDLAIKLIKEYRASGQLNEALREFDLMVAFSLPSEETNPDWAGLSVVLCAHSFLNVYQGPPKATIDKAIDAALTVNGGRYFRLTLAHLLTETLGTFLDVEDDESIPFVNSIRVTPVALDAEAVRRIEIYLEYVLSLNLNDYSPIERPEALRIRSEAVTSYLRILARSEIGGLDKALALREKLEASHRDADDAPLVKRDFTRDAAFLFLYAGKLPEATEIYFFLQKDANDLERLIAQIELAYQLVCAIIKTGELDATHKIVDSFLDTPFDGPLTQRFYCELRSRLVVGYVRSDLLEEALNHYVLARQVPLTPGVFASRIRSLVYLVSAFAHHGETATATHLLVNRDQIDLNELRASEGQVFNEELGFAYSSKAIRPPEGSLPNENLYEYSKERCAELGQVAAELVSECLNCDEDDRALTVYRVLETLPHVDPDTINATLEEIFERLYKNDRRAEARALFQARGDKLPTKEYQILSGRIERLVERLSKNDKAGAGTGTARKTKAKGR
jgi:hypothetical protein